MLFNSLAFLIFFPIVILLYFLFPHKYRWLLLLIASVFFYMFFIPYFILILVGTILVDYFAGILIEKSKTKSEKRWWLIASLIANIGCLAVFKYYNFANDNISALMQFFGMKNPIPFLSIILPIGLSFHTFQAMSYTIEVYRSNFKAEKHFGYYALYVLYFPQLVAGPIERPQNVLPQLHQPVLWNNERIISGFRLVLWGLFKKVVIADRLSLFVGNAYTLPHESNPSQLLFATYMFAFQIYCDFSGYSDIAIGSSRILGINLMKNFNNPYIATSIQDFWRRWHISLSTWFRDYLYIPLGGSKKGKNKYLLNLLIIFVVSGVWHGANWTYVVWGSLHAIFQIFTVLLPKRYSLIKDESKLYYFKKAFYMFLTFQAVCLAWVFFRVDTVSNGMFIINEILFFVKDIFIHPITFAGKCYYNIASIGAISWLLIISLLIFESKIDISKLSKSSFGNYAFFIFMILIISILGKSTQEMFIYFQF
ncbi:MAG: MBOAT family O-acyltransferase [Bacteroidota bacterium]